ncbi:MAG: FG-GAP-like repeat-containing protein, partial [Dysgonamonadaceae bacterium]|nr:FG-GAP-like repeat-containing protein [Dysgonamonadaceae bacterium]
MKRHIIFLAICSVYTIAVFSQINTGETFNLSAPDSGNKTYIARESITLSPGFRYTATSENNFNAKIDKTLLFPPTEGKYINENGIIVNSAYEGAVVGSVAGQLDVSPTGAATYTIPIECPEGIQGIQPNLALVYNSQTGNSILGWGWNLSGISAITRTGKDYYHDSSAASVKLNVMDNLMLDGQRLYLISGTHFSANAEYRTEIESFSKIIYKYIDGYMGFEVTTKGGSKMEYGSSTDSYIEAQGSNVPLQWLLKKVSDRNGNYLNYEYYENTSNGECRLSKIKYTGNSAANLLPFSAIEFMYKARTDTITNYIAGKLIMEPKLLDYILVKTNNQILKKYSITYSTEGLYSQITSITEELSDGARYKPIKICWKDESVIYSKTGEEDSYLGLFEHITDLNPIFADFNGDGRRDFITVKDKVVKLYINYDFSGISFPKKTEFTVYGDNYKAVIPADLNGDGLMDIIGVTHAPNNTYRYNYYFFDGNSFSGVSGGFNTTVADNDYVIGDFNGDGKHEILIKSTEKLYDGTGTVIGSGGITDWGDELFSTFPNCLNLFDVTGNGKTNICIRTGNTGYVYEFNGSTFELLFSTSELSNKQDIYPGDYNNDGKIDLFVIKSNSSYGPYGYETFWLLSTGNSFVKKILPRLTLSEKTLKGFGGDFNLDGKYDFALVEYESRGISFYVKFKIGINNGSGFDFVSYTSNMPLNEREDWQKLDCADYDGDGRYDFTYHKYSDVWMNKSFDDTFFARIKSISNGFETHYVDYLPVTSRYIYNTEEQYSVNFPVTKTLFPFYVVQRLYDNIYYSISYYYKNIRTHKQGKGFLGFEKISATNSRNNQTVSSIYDYNHTYFNVYPAKQIVSVNTGNTTDTVSASVFSNNIIYFGGKRVFPYQSGQISTNYLTGLTTDVSIHNYDIYGNPDSVRTIRGNHTETKIFKYTDNGSWCNYLPQKITVKQQWDNDIITRISTFGYDTKGNIINDTIDVGDVNQYITSYSNYDAFGNPQKITTSANGVSRSQTLTYTPSGRFVKTRTNDLLNETITYHYYEERGLLTAETSRLGWISYGYDACNRLVETHYPDGTKSVNTLLWAANRSDKPLGAKYYSYSETSGESPLTVWYDALGREIRSESYGLNQKKIQISTEYNTKGQVSTVWGPYFENETSINATDYLYDSYGRIKKITDVEGITTYTYNGLTTTVTTPSGSSSTTVNSAGLTTSQTTNGKSVAFTHYANGQVKTATPQGGTAITMEYNLQGKRTSLVDPDAGTVKSKYDGWGQLLVDSQYVHSKTTPVVTTYNYTQAGLLNYMQRVGKQTQRTDYIYDSLNRLKTVRIAGQHSQTYYYDNFDRIIQSVDSITNSTVFKRSTEFDQLGRVYKQIYPDGFTVSNIYDRNGYLTHVKKFDDNSLLWQAKESNARGQLTKTQQGSKETIYSFNAKGFPVSIVTAGITNLSYVFNAKGNLSSRKDGISIYKDSMYYDSMNRLTNWHIYQGSTITQSNSLSFNATTGNIQSKTGISTAMTYGENGKPHALTSLDPVSSYVPAGQTLTYTDFRKIKTVSHNGTSYSLVYGTDEQRIKSTHTKSGTTTSKYYLGDY